MIRLPDLDTPGLPKPRVPARPPGRYDVDAEWGGPASLGPAALKRADDLRWGWDVVGADEAEHRLVEWQRREDEGFDTTVQALAPADAKGFAEEYANDYFARAKAFKASLPEAMWPAIDEKLARYEQRLFVKATAVEDNAQAGAARNRLEDSLQATVIPAAVAAAGLHRDDPDKPVRLADAETLVEQLIDANPAIAPHEKEARKAAVAGAIHTAFAEALPGEERRDLDPAAAVESVGARLRRLAGAGGVSRTTDSDAQDAANEKRTPINPDGFGREAWLAAIRRHRLDLAKGRSIVDILALRGDSELSAEIRDESIVYSAEFLIGHSHAATPGNLFLAHIISPEGAVRLLDADPRRSAAEIDATAAKEWPDLFNEGSDPAQPRTTGAVIAVAEEAMAGARPVDWRQRLHAASPNLLQALAQDAEEVATRATAAAKLADEDTYQARLEEAERAIEAGEFGLAALQKANGEDGWVRSTEDFLRLHALIAKRAADTLNYDKAVSKYTDPNYHFDAASPEDQQAVDLLYERGTDGNAAGLIEGDPDAIAFLRRLVARAGIIPTDARQTLEEAIVSGDDAAREQALAIVEELSERSSSNERALHSLESLERTAAHTEGQDGGGQSTPGGRDVQSDRLIPGREKALAELIAEFRNVIHENRSGGLSIADSVAVAEDFRDQLLRRGVSIIGEEAVETYDRAMAALDEKISSFREEAHRYIDNSSAGLSALEIDNRKALVDFFITTAMVIAPGGKPGRRADRKRDQEPGREVGHDTLPTHIDRKTGLVVVEVKTTRQRSSDAVKGTPEYHALNYPKPNTIYRLDNQKEFRTNAYGYTEYLEFVPVRDKRGRDPRQTEAGQQGREGDQGGHLQGAALGGSSDRFNLIAQDANFNNGAFKSWESDIRRDTDRVETVRITLLRKDPSNPRPDELRIEYVVGGITRSRKFKNSPGGE